MSQQEGIQVEVEPKAWKLEKFDAAGELFEVVEGGKDKPTVVTLRKDGQPPESYAKVND